MPVLTTHATPSTADVVVIGAGINGLAIARETAARGLRTVVLDSDDVAAKTSAISTRLIHGGLKYLERFELPLVFESIRERKILLRTAPHRVRPYPMLIPFSRTASRPGWLLACGLALHDVLSLGKKLPFNRVVLSRGLRRGWPSVAEGGVRWGGVFLDAHVPLTERFAIELAIDATKRGAVFLTHSPVTGFVRGVGAVRGVRYRDRVTGQERSVQARIVVNAAGPWVDSVLALGDATEPRRIGPTKGSHLVVDPFPGAPDTCVFFESPDDNRPMFVLPWWGGKYMIGTTDLPYDDRLDEIVMDDEETAYLLRAVNTLIPRARLTADDVLWSYSGVRPLPYVADMKDPASVTRDSDIVVHDGELRGVISIIGGKYTTQRALGEQTARRIDKILGRANDPSPTRGAMLPGAPAGDVAEFSTRFVRRSVLPEAAARRLVEVYGALAERIEEIAAADPSLTEVVDPETGAIAAEVVYAVREEGAVTLEDVLLRRTVIALNSDVGLTAAPRATAVLVRTGHWDEGQAEAELTKYQESVRRFRPKPLRSGAHPTVSEPAGEE